MEVATHPQLDREKEKEIWSCPVCLEHEHYPLMLGCGHSLCQLCLSKLPRKLCPTCRADIAFFSPNYDMGKLLNMEYKDLQPDTHPPATAVPRSTPNNSEQPEIPPDIQYPSYISSRSVPRLTSRYAIYSGGTTERWIAVGIVIFVFVVIAVFMYKFCSNLSSNALSNLFWIVIYSLLIYWCNSSNA